MIIEIVKFANLTLAFLLELCALAALGYWGYQTGSSRTLSIAMGILAPLAMATVWGVFLAPNSSTRLVGWPHLSLELLIFGLVVVALWAVGKPALAIIMASATIVNQVLAYVWAQ